MAELALHFEMSHGTDLTQAADSLQERLMGLPSVEEVAALPEAPRFTGLEVLVAVAITVKIVHATGSLVEELRRLLQQVKGLVGDVKDLKNITVDVGPKRVALSELTDAQMQQLAQD